MSVDDQWWVLASRYGAFHTAPAVTEALARAWVRDLIAESFLSEGLSPSAARRAAGTYSVSVVAGGCTREEAKAAVGDGFDGVDFELAQRLHDRWIAGTRRRRQRLAVCAKLTLKP